VPAGVRAAWPWVLPGWCVRARFRGNALCSISQTASAGTTQSAPFVIISPDLRYLRSKPRLSFWLVIYLQRICG
jgi:hypothetical protein